MSETDFVEQLVSAVPDAKALIADHFRDNDELLLHVLMADLLRFTVAAFAAGDVALSQRCLQAVERGLVDGDDAVVNAVAVSFVEHIGAYTGETPEFIASWPQKLRAEKARQEAWPN